MEEHAALLLLSLIILFFVERGYIVASGDSRFNKTYGIIMEYTGPDADGLSIPADIDGVAVTAIGEGAFGNCTFSGSLIIPNSVTEIGRNAFTGGNFSGQVVVGKGVENIGIAAFASNYDTPVDIKFFGPKPAGLDAAALFFRSNINSVNCRAEHAESWNGIVFENLGADDDYSLPITVE